MYDRRSFVAAAVATAAGVGATMPLTRAFAQVEGEYPARTIRMLVGYPPGGGADILGRIFVARFGEVLGQPVVVENRPGAGATMAATALAGARPDGYTLYFAESAILVAPAIYEKIAYDPLTLTPVGGLGSIAYSVVVNPSFPATTIGELIALLKAEPGKYNYASPGVGNIAHLSAELFKKAAGVQMTHVPYKGGAPALADVVGGQVPICFVSIPPTLPLVKSGKLRLLAVTGAARAAIAPDTPSLAESLPGFDAVANIFLLAPPGTPASIVSTLNAAMRKTMAMAEVRSGFKAQGAEVAVGSPQALATRIADELGTWGAIARSAGARAG